MVDKLLAFLGKVLENPWSIVGLIALILLADRIKLYDKVKRMLGKDEERNHKRQEDVGNNHVHKRMDEEDSRLLHEVAGKVKEMENYGMRLAGVENSLSFERERFNKHMEKEAQEDIMLAEMKSEQSHIREKFEDLKETFEKLEENQKDAFRLIGDLKNHLIK